MKISLVIAFASFALSAECWSAPYVGKSKSCWNLETVFSDIKIKSDVACAEVTKTLKAIDEYKLVIIPRQQSVVDQKKAEVARLTKRADELKTIITKAKAALDAATKDALLKRKLFDTASQLLNGAQLSNSPQLATLRAKYDEATRIVSEAEAKVADGSPLYNAWYLPSIELFNLNGGDLGQAKSQQKDEEAKLAQYKKGLDVATKDNLPSYQKPCKQAQADYDAAMKEKTANKCGFPCSVATCGPTLW